MSMKKSIISPSMVRFVNKTRRSRGFLRLQIQSLWGCVIRSSPGLVPGVRRDLSALLFGSLLLIRRIYSIELAEQGRPDKLASFL